MDESGEPVESCRWCGRSFSEADQAKGKLFCDPGHRQKYKRAHRAADLADHVESLRPYVMDDGLPIFQGLVDRLAGTIRTGRTP